MGNIKKDWIFHDSFNKKSIKRNYSSILKILKDRKFRDDGKSRNFADITFTDFNFRTNFTDKTFANPPKTLLSGGKLWGKTIANFDFTFLPGKNFREKKGAKIAKLSAIKVKKKHWNEPLIHKHYVLHTIRSCKLNCTSSPIINSLMSPPNSV